jgi:H+/Cl- antiporter ClcA
VSAVASSPDAPPGAGARALRLVVVGGVLGVPAALFAAVFLAIVHEVEHWLWTDLPHDIGTKTPPWYLVIGLPVVGAGVCVVARSLLPGDGGRTPLQGLSGQPTPIRYAPGIALAALGTLSFGAVLGPEGPLIALGSVAGLAVATLARAGQKESAVLAGAGSFAAIAALFGGPIVGGLMMVEGGVGLGAALIPTLIPGFVAAATGYVLFIGLGSWGGLSSQAIAVPGLPLYQGTHVLDLLVGIGVGVAAALVVSTVRRYAGAVEDRGPKRMSMPALLLLGGLAVGLLAQIAQWLGANSQDVLFSGQSGIPDLIAQTSTKIVLILLVAKAIGYAISLGCGFRGGPVFPAIFLGVALATLTEIWFGVSPTLAVAVGTAAGMTATSRLMLTPIVFSALLVGHNGADTVSAAMLASAAAWLTLAVADRRGRGGPATGSASDR